MLEQVNQTLDASATTFPLKRSIYADFSHDNERAELDVMKETLLTFNFSGSPQSSRRWDSRTGQR